MADPPTDSDAGGGTPAGADREAVAYPGTPRWVKTVGIAAVLLIVLIGIAMLIGGGQHGPGRHLPSGGAGDQLPLAAQGAHRP